MEIVATTDKILDFHCVFCPSGLALIYDLCGGDPVCTTGAIVYDDTGVGARAKRESLAVDVGRT